MTNRRVRCLTEKDVHFRQTRELNSADSKDSGPGYRDVQKAIHTFRNRVSSCIEVIVSWALIFDALAVWQL